MRLVSRLLAIALSTALATLTLAPARAQQPAPAALFTPESTATPWTGSTPVDLLPFLVGDDAHWPRTGSHDLDRRWDGRSFWLIKFGHADHWERWELDGDRFRLREDRSQSGAGDYSFHPGRWFPRRMTVGQVLDEPENVIQEYDPRDCAIKPSTRTFPYRVRLLRAWTRIALGGDIGTLDGQGEPVAVLLEYDPGDDGDTRETSLYARGWGLVRWQDIAQPSGEILNETTFTRLGGVAGLVPTAGCLQPLAPFERREKPTITIRDDFGPKSGRAPHTWRATAITTGDVTRIVWRWRKQGDAEWSRKTDEARTTMTFSEPGTYEIGVDGFGPGGSDGTAIPRLIIVR